MSRMRGSALADIVEGAERTREELVPARELGLRPLDLDGDRLAAIGQGAIVDLGDAAARFGCRQQADVLIHVAVGQGRHDPLQFQPNQVRPGIGDLGGHVDAGAMLDLQRMAKGARIRRARPRS